MLDIPTYAALKAFLALEKAAITDYPDLEVIREGVYSRIESYTKRKLVLDAAVVQTFYVGARVKQLFALSHLPINSITSITIDGTATSGYTRIPGGIRSDREIAGSTIVITYSGGYADAADVPDNIKRAALLQVVHEFQRRKSIGATTITTQGGTAVVPELDLLKEVRACLAPARHPMALLP